MTIPDSWRVTNRNVWLQTCNSCQQQRMVDMAPGIEPPMEACHRSMSPLLGGAAPNWTAMRSVSTPGGTIWFCQGVYDSPRQIFFTDDEPATADLELVVHPDDHAALEHIHDEHPDDDRDHVLRIRVFGGKATIVATRIVLQWIEYLLTRATNPDLHHLHHTPLRDRPRGEQ